MLCLLQRFSLLLASQEAEGGALPDKAACLRVAGEAVEALLARADRAAEVGAHLAGVVAQLRGALDAVEATHAHNAWVAAALAQVKGKLGGLA